MTEPAIARPSVPTDGLVLLIEPRVNHAALPSVIRNIDEFIPASPAWMIWWIHGTHEPAADLLAHLLPLEQSGRLVRKRLSVPNLSIPAYNILLTSRDFWQSLPVENILIFQTDAIIHPNPAFSLMDFADMKDIEFWGAPWRVNAQVPWSACVGNGGISLRRRSAMLRCIEGMEYVPGLSHHEDVYFGYEGHQRKLVASAPTHWASKFAVETTLHGSEASMFPWASHKLWAYDPQHTEGREFERAFRVHTHKSHTLARLQFQT